MTTDKSKIVMVKEVLTDPGVDYNIADTILFASGTNTIGLASCLTAVGVSVISKTLAVNDTDFARKHPNISKILLDPKTPLWTNAAVLAIVSGVALVSGLWIPAACSLLWAIADIRIAQSVERAKRDKDKTAQNEEGQGQSKFRKALSLTFKRPDIYLNGGAIIAGLMAGGASVLAIPVIVAATIISLVNAMQNKPEYKGHPKILSALARGFNVVVGVVSGNWLPALALSIMAGVMVKVECEITPGGGRKILRDIKDGFINLFSRKKTAQPQLHAVAPLEFSERQTAVVLKAGELSNDFSIQSKRELPPDPSIEESKKINSPKLIKE